MISLSLVVKLGMLRDYLGLSDTSSGVELFPVSILEWEKFSHVANEFLLYDYRFVEFKLKADVNKVKLFDVIMSLLAGDILSANSLKCRQVAKLESMFSIVTKKDCSLSMSDDGKWFVSVGDTDIIDRDNFDTIREVIMRQNLIFSPLFVKDKYTQKVIDKAVARRNRCNGDFDFMSMIVFVCNMRGLKPSDMKDYTYYQLRCDSEMCQRIEFNDSIHHYKSQGAKVDALNVYAQLKSLSNPNTWDSFFKKIDSNADSDMMKAMGG